MLLRFFHPPTSCSRLLTSSLPHPLITTRAFTSSAPKMSSPLFSSTLLSPSTLHAALRTTPSNLHILCASWFLPTSPHTGSSVYLASHIPTARFFDLDAVKDASSPYPHMLPSATDFSAAMGLLGVKKTDTVVVYDSKELGLFSAPRVAWMLRAFGHEKVHILDNYREWCAHGLPTESGEAGEGNAVEYGEAKTPENVVGYEDMVAGAKNEFQGTVVLDARPAGRFKGMDPEPRPGLSSGHMPGSLSVPFSAVLDAETKTLLPRKKLREVFEKAGVREGMPIVSSCGTGVTAAVVDLALEEAGYKGERKIYDGSWSEYAARVGEGEGLIVKD